MDQHPSAPPINVETAILVKRPVRSGARRLEYRVTDKGEALRPALELIEGWGKAADAEEAVDPERIHASISRLEALLERLESR